MTHTQLIPYQKSLPMTSGLGNDYVAPNSVYPNHPPLFSVCHVFISFQDYIHVKIYVAPFIYMWEVAGVGCTNFCYPIPHPGYVPIL